MGCNPQMGGPIYTGAVDLSRHHDQKFYRNTMYRHYRNCIEISCKNIRSFDSIELEIGRAQLETCKTQ